MAAFCANCGSPLEAGSRFCQKCGAAVPSTPQPTTPPPSGSSWTPQPPPPPQQQWSPPPPPPPQPQWTPPPAGGTPMPPAAAPDKMKPILLGGLVAGLLSGIPFISAGNLCCCLWVVLGGVLAVYLYSRQVPVLMSGEAALLGLQSGMVAAVVNTIISIPIRFFMVRFMGSMQREMLGRIFEQNPDFPPQLRDLLQSLFSPGFMLGAILIGFIVSLIFFSIFGSIGGLIGNAMFKKKS